ncbi:MAG TPA: alpha-L-fucosidase [Bryobacteraceae bacterium]|nr:alpha-L-fucosidase [Bryobacteraceae bacterium]
MTKLCLLLLSGALLLGAQSYQPAWDSVDRRPVPSWFGEAKFGIFIHWGVYSVPSYAPVLPGKLAYAEWYWHAITEGRKPGAGAVDAGSWAFHQRVYGKDFPYQNFAPMFRAELFDPGHWADVFQHSGARYVVLTSKHHEGFALWPSREASATWGRPWNSVEIGPHRDLAGDLAAAVRARGLRMGFYYSLYEWYNPLWLSDKPRYIRDHMMPQFKDMVTRLRPALIFSDGEWDLPSEEWHSPELLAWLFNESPVKDDVVINDRWGKETRHKHGGYWTTEYTAGLSGLNHPWEESRGMGFSYGYNRAERLQDYHTGRELVILLTDLVSRGGNLLLDIGPAADGTIPVIMEERLLQMGDWLKVNGEAIYGTRPWKVTRQWRAHEEPKVDYSQEFNATYDVTKVADSIEAFFTAKGNDVYAILPRWPSGPFTLREFDGAHLKSAALLGSTALVHWKAAGNAVTINPPVLPESLMKQPAWVLKLSQ